MPDRYGCFSQARHEHVIPRYRSLSSLSLSFYPSSSSLVVAWTISRRDDRRRMLFLSREIKGIALSRRDRVDAIDNFAPLFTFQRDAFRDSRDGTLKSRGQKIHLSAANDEYTRRGEMTIFFFVHNDEYTRRARKVIAISSLESNQFCGK